MTTVECEACELAVGEGETSNDALPSQKPEEVQIPEGGLREPRLTTVHDLQRRFRHCISILHKFFGRDDKVNVIGVPGPISKLANAGNRLAETSDTLDVTNTLDPISTDAIDW